MTQVLAVRTMGAAGIANQDLAGLIVREAPAESLILVGGRARIRTGDLRIKSPLLCRLSYAPLTPRNIGPGPGPVNSRHGPAGRCHGAGKATPFPALSFGRGLPGDRRGLARRSYHLPSARTTRQAP